MGKEAALYDEAERLYVEDGKTLEEIGNTLQVSTTTLSKWKSKGDWADQRARYLKSERHFKDVLNELKKKLANRALEDPTPQNIYALCRVIAVTRPYIAEELKKIEAEEEQRKKRGLTPDMIKLIKEEILGVIE